MSSKLGAVLVGKNNSKIYGLSSRQRIEKLLDVHKIPILNKDFVAQRFLVIDVSSVFDEHFIGWIVKKNNLTVLNETDNQPIVLITSDQNMVHLCLLKNRIIKPRLFKCVRSDLIPEIYFKKQLKYGTPYIEKQTVCKKSNILKIEKKIYQSTYKGITDICTMYFWYHLAFYITRLLAARQVRPNTVTFFSMLFCLISPFLIINNYFNLGIFFAWLMMILDTVDGKLARVTMTSSKFGDFFDHGIDLIHPPFWYFAWGQAIVRYYDYSSNKIMLIYSFIFFLYLIGRLTELLFTRRFGIKMFEWRKFDKTFRLFLARRNTNFLILTSAYYFNGPVNGFLIMSLWTAICVFIQVVCYLQACFYLSTSKC